MNTVQAVVLNLGIASTLANVPFLRLIGLRRLHPAWNDFLGWVAAYAIWMAVSVLLEAASSRVMGKGWEVWAITSALFAVLAFPGIVWRHLLQK